MNCCKKNKIKNKGILMGIFYGVFAHSFCILFIVLTILGATTITTVLRPVFMSNYFIHILVFISIFFATVSALIYLKKNNQFSLIGIKEKKNYLFVLYGTTVFINLFLFLVIFPISANITGGSSVKDAVMTSFKKKDNNVLNEGEKVLSLSVNIPCSGHAYLVFSDLDDFSGIENIDFTFPNNFDIIYNPEVVSAEEILSVDVFQNYETLIK